MAVDASFSSKRHAMPHGTLLASNLNRGPVIPLRHRRRIAVSRMLLVVASASPVAWAADAPPPKTWTAVARDNADLLRLRSGPHLLYRSALGGEAYGRLAVVALDRPDDPPLITNLKCHRAYYAGGRGICLGSEEEALRSRFFTLPFDRALQSGRESPLVGFPSRARISPAGRYAAATTFVEGDSYGGKFSTRTLLYDLQRGQSLGDLELFAVSRNGKPFKSVDFNFWGVTFGREEGRFFATLGTGGRTYLITGDVRERTARVLRENVECPSLSPDGKRIAFKKRIAEGRWRLHTLDLATLQERPIAGELRSVDDQVEWLDDGHVLYEYVELVGLPQLAANIWIAAVDQPTPARVFVRAATAPVVVREAVAKTAAP